MPARTKDIPMLTLRAQITIEVAALDYVEAADHQKRAEALFAAVRTEYGAATFTFHHLRPRTKSGVAERPRRRGKTRALAVYHDL